MKNKISFLILLLGLLSVTINYAQPNYGTNDPLDGTSSALGDGNIVTSDYSTALGLQNEITGFNSFAFGRFNKSIGSFSFALGDYNESNQPFSYTFGKRMINNTPNSFLVGFVKPAFIATANNSGVGTRVGIATDDPQARLDVRLGDKQEIRIQSEMDNTYGGLSFRDHLGGETWRIRAFNNFTGGYNSILSIVSSQKHDLWISAGKTMIGDWFDFDPCSDCDDYELFVKKGIRTQKIKVDLAAGVWADYVFEKDYDLKPLEEVEAFINANGHLPNVPTASEIEKEGLNLGEMDAKLLEKIEELTLYVIELKKEINELKSKN
ncbi:hypothetical protein EZY14_011735 [Kordia sp. TARA_039_SRF]|nr:hypothetical protein EZY14_011735 [Kordia sp. TARA_039_SRF]